MLLIAHRTGLDEHPEQTILSARRSLADGAAMVEMDVAFTRGGEAVICHDPNAFRVFGVNRDVADMSLGEFMTLRHKGRREYPSHSLEDVLDAGVKPLLLHVKDTGDCLIRVVATLKAHGFVKDTCVGVLTAADVRLVKALEPSLRVLGFMGDAEDIERFCEAGADAIRLWEAWLTPERVARVKAAGRKLWVMVGGFTEETCGYTSEASLSAMRAMGADGVLVNDVRFARKALGL